ncbi:MAG: NAD(P)/FAD-dependent oxidoreductase [Eubacteriales bacterium]|nr:NAD(P)/FAD-dependent oxidoreductase [Eubacteriales bacterium]
MDILVIGGGPSGMMSAYCASKNNKNKVYLYEKNEKLGKKLFITGKGRCNVTNMNEFDTIIQNITRNKKFMYSSLHNFSNKELYNFLEEKGCKLKIERGNRVFPLSDKSYSVTDALKKAMNEENVYIKLKYEVVDIKKVEQGEFNSKFEVQYKNNNDTNNEIKKSYFDKVIIATGGISYPQTGSTGDGYKFAKKFGHNIIKLYPSLVGIVIRNLINDDINTLQGLTLKNVSIKLYHKDSKQKIIFKDFGEMLFTHYGISGPIVLSLSSFLSDKEDIKDYRIDIDLKPALSFTELDKRIIRDFSKYQNKELKNALIDLLPQKIILSIIYKLDCVCKYKNNSIGNKKVCDITKDERKELVNMIKEFKILPIELKSFDEAIITKGGIDCNEINPKTMESKLVKGLYFAGEVIDVDCLTGGYNLTIAFSSAYSAGSSVSNY